MSTSDAWRSEYTLETDEVQRLVSDNTAIEVLETRFLGEGWDFFNWLINGEWVFRFPKRHEEIDTLVQERKLLNSLSLSIDIPKFEIWVPKPSKFMMPFAGYRYLKGDILCIKEATDEAIAQVGPVMGNVLRELHGVQVTRSLVPADPARSATEGISSALPSFKAHLTSETYRQIDQAQASYQVRSRVGDQVTAHNDLGVAHILVNDACEPTGIIDWADAETTSRYVDFAGLWIWGGDELLRAMLSSYPIEPTLEDLAQIRILGLFSAIVEAQYGILNNNKLIADVIISWMEDRVAKDELTDLYRPL